MAFQVATTIPDNEFNKTSAAASLRTAQSTFDDKVAAFGSEQRFSTEAPTLYGNLKRTIKYYSPGGQGYQDALRDFNLQQAKDPAAKLGITAAQLVTNPELASNTDALAGYKGITVEEASASQALIPPQTSTESITAPPIEQVDNTITEQDVQQGPAEVPDLPSIASPSSSENLAGGLQNEVDSARSTLDSALGKELEAARQREADAKARMDAEEARISALEGQQEGIITGDVKNLLQPFREELEKAERERLKIEENFFANQRSIAELEQLMTQGLDDLEAMRQVTGLASIRQPRIQKAAEDLMARASVIQAVVAMRNNQIGIAEGLIDRSINAITQDRNDQLTYWNAVLDFMEGKKVRAENRRSEARQDALQASSDQKAFVNAQINLLERDLNTAEEAFTNVRNLLLDPSTAPIVEAAGVKLTDSPEVVAKKFATYNYREEVRTTSNALSAEGWQYVTAEAAATKPTNDLITITDSQGVQRTFYKPNEPGKNTSIVDIAGRRVMLTVDDNGNLLKRTDLGASSASGTTTEAGVNSATIDAIMENPLLFSALSASERAAVTPALQARGFDFTAALNPEQATQSPGQLTSETVGGFQILRDAEGNVLSTRTATSPEDEKNTFQTRQVGKQLVEFEMNPQGQVVGQRVVSTIPDEPTASEKLTPDELAKLGLPRTAPNTDEALTKSLNEQAPPRWFMDWINTMESASGSTRTISPQEAQARWDEIRFKLLTQTSGGGTGDTDIDKIIAEKFG